MSVGLTVHRSAHEIGGNCIEISAPGGHRIILDVGRPLDAANDASGLLPPTLDLGGPADGVLISHPHQDHYGLLHEAPADWAVYCGGATEQLIKLTSGIFGAPITRPFRTWRGGETLAVGPFAVTPFLTDHSAFDAYMLLIEIDGRRILYSGDFRVHGRKSALVSRFMTAPPKDIDVLLMEGTNLGSTKPWMSENDLEADFAELFRDTPGRVFVSWSAQNIDRTVTLYRACLKTGRTLVLDLYTAEVLDLLAEYANLPQPGWRQIKVVVTRAFADLYRRSGREAFVARMAQNGIAARKLSETPSQWVVMTRRSLIQDYQRAGVVPVADDAWSWSMWRGYLDSADGARVRGWLGAQGARTRHIHTSGHASPEDLRAFARSVAPKRLVPIHGIAWDGDNEGFASVTRLADGQTIAI
jgi:ribonuclease J